MVEKRIYEILKEKYGHVASWAIWRRSSGAIKSNIGDYQKETGANATEINRRAIRNFLKLAVMSQWLCLI